ncbi:Bifunctional polynucleotide phosphatase/kinase [Zancudomyces culisetae]|uniref:Bifunctional polynucleotide phosphatase/kinase n=1 Tax=Zancudomyces culisetae TaxID=1213189 RepID=A0A1R1PE01_ZANCU|nr:Bifunctional polynucleotide phosphatase/kinase [Zancudomyces culisetae]OMH81137.1 Bifunctional polynucleotide phosphatase/kinase [Zancudomyces culisetae]|eukprot:OMH79207.1 Bifunctional polynucleotide phosphatase/kinase [Zancudomyces culisetae]
MPQLLVLVGIPGSGKTEFSQKLVKFLKNWERINKDELGDATYAESLAAVMLKNGKNVVIDGYNHNTEHRKIWVEIAELQRVSVDALYFEESTECCTRRVKHRANHPTGIQGDCGVEITISFGKSFTYPSITEGFRFIQTLKLNYPKTEIPLKPDDVLTEDVIKNIMKRFPAPVSPPNFEDLAKSCEPPKNEVKPQPQENECKKVEIVVKCDSECEKAKESAVSVVEKKKEEKKEKKVDDFWVAPWTKKECWEVVKPNEGFGTYKETKAMWEDEDHNQFFNHSLLNEQTELEVQKEKCVKKHTAYIQHSDRMENASKGRMRSFDHMSVTKNASGHQILGDGTKEHFHDCTQFLHQREEENDAKEGKMRSYDYKAVKNCRHIHTGDPEKARTEAFEHQSFVYFFKGGCALDPEKIMVNSMKTQPLLEQEIVKNLENWNKKENLKFIENVKWENDLNVKPNFSVFK